MDMASRDSMVRELLEALRDSSEEELSEVVDFAEFLRARRAKHATTAAEASSLDERETRAGARGLVRLPEPGARRFSTTEVPPIKVAGKPASEIVIEDRR